MKAAIIGVNGYLGKHLARLLLQQGWEVEGYGRAEQAPFPLTAYRPLDIRQKDQFASFNTAVDYVFYFSGITGTSRAYNEYEKYIETNETGLLHLLDTLRHSTARPRVIFPSSRLVYKGVTDTPLVESAEKEFKTVYALNKWFGEQMLEQYARYFDIPFTIFRVCVPYGNSFDDSYSYGTIGFFLQKAKAGQDITLFGNGQQKRTFTHVSDICEQVFQAIQLDASANKIYNIGGQAYSLQEIAGKISGRFGTGLAFTGWPKMDELMESGDTIFDASSLLGLIGIPVKMDFDSWLSTIR